MRPQQIVVGRDLSRDRVFDRQERRVHFAAIDRPDEHREGSVATRLRAGDEVIRGLLAERAGLTLKADRTYVAHFVERGPCDGIGVAALVPNAAPVTRKPALSK